MVDNGHLIHYIGKSLRQERICQLVLASVQSNLSGTTTLNVKKKWSFQTGVRSRKVQFAWNPLADRIFHKLENGLSREGGLSRRGRYRQVSQNCADFCERLPSSMLALIPL